jgi:hypothetical protein
MFWKKIKILSAIGAIIAAISFVARWIIEKIWNVDVVVLGILFIIIYYQLGGDD